MTLYTFPDDVRDLVKMRITLFDEPGTQTAVTITRVHADGTSAVLAADLLPLCEEVYYDDTTPPIGAPFHYLITSTPDNVNLVSADITLTEDPGVIHLQDPSRPWADLTLSLCAEPATACPTEAPVPCLTFVRWGTETYAADATLLDILNRERPADVYARRKDAAVSSLRFLSRHADGDCSCIDGVRTLFTAGGPIALRFPAVYCIPDRCYQPLDLSMSYLSDRVDQRKPWRMWEVPLAAVDCPTGTKQGIDGATWCDVAAEWATYADMTAAAVFWGEIRTGSAMGA